jgi:hypothetical protein
LADAGAGMTGTTMDAAAAARNRLRMKSPPICIEFVHARCDAIAAGETMFNDNHAVYDELLLATDTVLKRYV